MAKEDDKLSSFKIGDLRRPVVRGGKPGEKEKAVAAEAPASAGFPAIEERLEKSSIEAVAEELRPTYEKLEALSSGTNTKLKGPAKKAMAAYERAADLFEYLFATKTSIHK